MSVSDRAVKIGQLVEKAKGLDDIRHERVEALRQRIHAGHYQVSAKDIAAAILRDEK